MKGGLEAGSIVHNWYQLESLLGFGAMGQVWKALDLQRQRAGDPHPHVALKLVSHEFAQHRHAMVAMQREASKAQQLAHPNIATVFVFAEDPTTGQGYLAMELLEGQPLDRMLREYPSGIPRDRALDIIRGIASGLAYAHAKGIVHCDFKPGNAFVTDAGVAKVLDFGIARLAHAVARDGDSFDAGVLEALTPPYASLEMLQGGDPSPADDVYALGLVAYEVLAGRHPFGGRAATEVLEKGLKARPPKGVRRREWRAIERALRLRRSERWPDAQAFLKALAGTSPWVLAMGGLAAIFAVGAGYASYQNWREAQPAQPFESLPEATQAEFRRHMELGSDAYRFAEGAISDEEAASVIYRDAIEQFAEAYSLHPKNHEAEAALRSSLDLLGDRLEKANSALRKEALVTLQDYKENQFPALRRYAPLDQTIADLDK